MKIKVKITPNSKINKIVLFKESTLFIKISKPPINNKANSELLKFLEDIFEVKGVKIIYGERGREKLIEIPIDENSFLEKIKMILN
ncbi:MAG: DUF167 domain-containing protein [Caldisericia bacterium]|nr:DUF167 domain-containing protein [Caldisericia bacterium]